MSYVRFLEAVAEEMQKRLGEGYLVRVKDVKRLNGVVKLGITIIEEETRINPVIYAESMYQEYLLHHNLDRCVTRLLECYQEGRKKGDGFLDGFFDWETIRYSVYPALMQKEKNMQYKEGLVQQEFLNLLVYFRVHIENSQNEETGSVCITKDMCREWKITEQEVREQAMENLNREHKKLLSLADMVRAMAPAMEADMDEADNIPMYVATNEQSTYGAGVILDTDFMRRAGEKLGGSFYILPSSIHETLFCMASGIERVEDLQEMVCEVNETQVAEEEQLGCSIYYYNREEERLEIACA